MSALAGDCHICHHAWPTQRLCSACGPWCSPCKRSLLSAYNALVVAAQAVLHHWHEFMDGGTPGRVFDERLADLARALDVTEGGAA